MKYVITILFSLFAVGLSACSEDIQVETAPIRPVLSIIAQPRENIAVGFAGTVEAKFSTDLGFQTLGRVIARHVNVGDLVKKGQLLAELDSSALQLAVNQADADLASAVPKLNLAKVNEQRQNALAATAASSKEQLEEAVLSREVAEATVLQLRASRTKANEQLQYAKLKSGFDGLVSAVSAEVGQVVSSGQTVMTIARLEARDAVVDISDSYSDLTTIGTSFEIVLQANPEVKTTGTVRETAPQADAATRTKRTKIALQSSPASFRLGSTVTATPLSPSNGNIWLPQSAIGGPEGQNFVWVVDMTTETVSRRSVTVRHSTTDGFDVISGLIKGERVVTAGVNSLTDNQPVRIQDEMAL